MHLAPWLAHKLLLEGGWCVFAMGPLQAAPQIEHYSVLWVLGSCAGQADMGLCGRFVSMVGDI